MAKNDVTKSGKEKDKAKKAVSAKEPKKKGGLKRWFRELKSEMKKVVWPTRSELGSYTVVVLAVCAAFALLFWGVDSAVLAGIKAICF